MNIRTMKLEDMEALDKLYYQFWQERSNLHLMCSTFLRLINRDDYILLCAEVGQVVVGSIMGIVCEELYGDCRPFLVVENLVVDKESRGMRIGRALMDTVIERAREKTCSQVILVTESHRQDACKFYESIGFHPTKNKGYKMKL